jgi:vacuolar iron transporter family protein
VSEEAASNNSHEHVWQATFATFFSKFVFALTFIIPVLLLPLQTAIIVSVVWGLLLIGIFSYYIGEDKKLKVIAEHLIMAVVVILITNFVGGFVNNLIL